MALETTKETFDKLKDRLICLNSCKDRVNNIHDMLYEISHEQKPTLIIATGGSKVVAYYLQLVLERTGISGTICEVIEPRDYFYKYGLERFSNLIAISASGNTLGIEEALNDFKGKKFLVCENEREGNFEVVSWGNESYDREHSFISVASSLGPITMMADDTELGCHKFGVDRATIESVNKKIEELLRRSQEKIARMAYSFKDASVVQLISGYDTKCSSVALESNLVEAGLGAPIVHDKGSLCHGRSNIISGDTPIIYLSHKKSELDDTLVDTLSSSYPNIQEFDSSDLSSESYFWREYYLLLQMYYLSKKIAEDKNMDLTKPNYNPKIIKPLYNYRGKF